jgi:hypothetical protein
VSAFLDKLSRDVRYVLRQMSRERAFTLVAVLSLALGIGANAAIFSLLNTLMLHRLPVPNPEQLVELLNRYPGEPRTTAFPSRVLSTTAIAITYSLG